MEKINLEAYERYLSHLGVINTNRLATEILYQNSPAQQIDFTHRRRTIEVEDCEFDQVENCWKPTGITEKVYIPFFDKKLKI